MKGLKRKQKVHVTFDAVVSCTVEDFFRLENGAPIPEKGSEAWKKAMAYWRDQAVVDAEFRIEATTTNPAHDPDTIPMFEELEPEPMIRWVVQS